MSTERKSPILVTVTVLTAIVGLITALYKCGAEQQNFLKAVNNPNIQYGEGLINVRKNATFAIRWQNTAYAQCSIGLFEQ